MKNNASPKMMLAAAFLVAGTAAGSAQDKKFEGVTLQINGYGGQWDEILAEYVSKPLEEKYGLKVEFQPGGSSAAVARLIASAGNPPFDMIMVDSPSIPDLIAAGVIDEVTAEQVPNLAKVLDGKREFGGYGVPYTTSSLVVSYNKELTDVTVNSLGDLANEKLSGRVGMFNLENTGGLLYMLALAKANGGDEQNMDPAFQALQAIKPNIATVTSSTTTLNQLFDQGEIWAGTLWSGRAFAMKKADRPIETAIPAEWSAVALFLRQPGQGNEASRSGAGVP